MFRAINLWFCLVSIVAMTACNGTSPQVVPTNTSGGVVIDMSPVPSVKLILTPNNMPEVSHLPTQTIPPSYPTSQAMPPIYIAVATYHSNLAQVWELNGGISRSIYQQESVLASDFMVPSNVQQEIMTYLKQNPDNGNFETVKLGVFFAGLRLSYDKEHLAWLTFFSWCPNEVTMKCFGFTQLNIVDLQTRILEIEIPADNALSNTVNWSPTGQFIAYTAQTTGHSGEIKDEVWMADIGKGQVHSLGAGDLPAWSLDGQKLAMVFRPSNSVSDLRIKIVTLTDPKSEQIIDHTWSGGLSDLSWEPKNNFLSVAGSMTAVDAKKAQKIFLVDTTTLLITMFSGQTSFDILDNPRWSLDGKLLAVNGHDSQNASVSALVIFKASGEMLIAFKTPGYSPGKWLWSSNGKTILRLLESTPPTKDDLQILDPLTGGIAPVALPAEIKDGIDDFSLYLSDIAW